MSTEDAGAIYGLYTFSVYALCLPGGWLADRLFGRRRAVLYGGIIIALGHYALAIPAQSTFFIGLALVATGTGLLKPNVSAIVADLYPEGGARRDAGFSIFYMGINVGALGGPLICSYLGEKVNWHLGFGAAGIGMTFAVIQYMMGQHHLAGTGEVAEQYQSPEARRQSTTQFLLGLALTGLFAGVLIALSYTGTIPLTLVRFAAATGVIIAVVVALYFAYLLTVACRDSTERKHIVMIGLLFIGAAVFWMGFEQAGSSMNIFAQKNTDRVIAGWEAPAGWLQQVNPLLIVLLAPVIGSLWIWLGRLNPSIPVKFGMGLVLLGVGFLVMSWASEYVGEGGEGKVSPNWLVATYFFHTLGELCLSPVGLSATTKLAPQRLAGQMMGVWFMGAALGNLAAGLVATRMEAMPLDDLFRTVAIIVIATGVIFFAITIPARKLTGGIK